MLIGSKIYRRLRSYVLTCSWSASTFAFSNVNSQWTHRRALSLQVISGRTSSQPDNGIARGELRSTLSWAGFAAAGVISVYEDLLPDKSRCRRDYSRCELYRGCQERKLRCFFWTNEHPDKAVNNSVISWLISNCTGLGRNANMLITLIFYGSEHIG